MPLQVGQHPQSAHTRKHTHTHTVSHTHTSGQQHSLQVGRALTANGIGHVSLAQRGRGARDAVARFKTDPSVIVFLLSLQHGAAGLTLVGPPSLSPPFSVCV